MPRVLPANDLAVAFAANSGVSGGFAFLPEAEAAAEGVGTTSDFASASLLFLGVTGKSAQLGLHTRLPDAVRSDAGFWFDSRRYHGHRRRLLNYSLLTTF